MVIIYTVEMGSCVMKAAPKVYNIGLQGRILHGHQMNSEYLKEEVRNEIFRAKDSKVPKLDLKRNVLYMKRMNQVNKSTTQYLYII